MTTLLLSLAISFWLDAPRFDERVEKLPRAGSLREFWRQNDQEMHELLRLQKLSRIAALEHCEPTRPAAC